MVRCSNVLLGFLNIITFILSIPILWLGVSSATKNLSECEKFLTLPTVVIGFCLMVLSLIGICGACCRSNGMLCLYFILMTLAIAVLVGFTGFALSVTHKGTSEILNDKAYEDFRLVDYSNWLPQRVNDDDNCKKIKSCLSDKNFCTGFDDEGLMTSLKSGCCKPSNDCKFTYEGPIKWNKTNGVYTNPDCSKWENSVETLCYNCQSCKAGVIDQVKRWWTEIAVTNAIFLGLLIFFYLLGCCACCNNRSRKNASHMYNPYHNPYYYAHKGGPPGPYYP